MFAKLHPHKKLLTRIVVVFAVVLSFFAYKAYDYEAFKRAYEHGTVYEQLIVLTGHGRIIGGKRYVDAVRKAGYEIDEYNLKMNDNITSLTTKKIGMRVVPLTNEIDIWYHYKLNGRPISVFQILSNQMELEFEGLYNVLDETVQEKERIELTKEEREYLREVTETEIKAMLKDIYDSMYPEEK